MKETSLGYMRLKFIDLMRGTDMLKALRELKKQQYWNRERLKKIEDERFEEILIDAAKSSSHYQNIASYQDLNILTKDVIKISPENFISTNYSSSLTLKATSGSTGSPLIYYTTREALSYMWAGIIFSWQIAGYALGDKVAFISGTSLFKNDFKHVLFHKLFNIKTYSTFSLNDEDIEKYIIDINKSKIKIIYGYATALNKMAEYILEKRKIDFPTLKGIVSSAEVLTDEHRKNIENAFGVKVYNQYGCNEGGVSAFECEENHLHLINTKCKYEIDSDGNLIASDLINKGFFMLRYFTGDKLIMDENNICSCGRGFPVIEKVIGRSYDIVIDNKNKILHAAFFNILFKEDPSIRQFQIQFDKSKISINLKVDEGCAKSERYSKYLDIIKQHLCFDEYNLNLNAPFLVSQNAKHKYVINTAA